jgi:Arc/MetJ-type ribon-helix-helix transcriptional regulator
MVKGLPSSYNLPELVKKEINALVKAGYYSSKSDVVKDALRTFLYSKRNLRLAAAAELYKDGEVTLGKAAEIADIGVIEFKEILANLGQKRVISVNRSDVKRADELIKKMR